MGGTCKRNLLKLKKKNSVSQKKKKRKKEKEKLDRLQDRFICFY